MRTHTVIAGLTSAIDEVPLEPGVTVSLNATTGDYPLTLISVTAGTRWRVVPKRLTADALFGYAATTDPQTVTRNELSLRGSGRWDVSKRQALWADAGLKWTVGEVVDRRVKASYEVRY